MSGQRPMQALREKWIVGAKLQEPQHSPPVKEYKPSECCTFFLEPFNTHHSLTPLLNTAEIPYLQSCEKSARKHIVSPIFGYAHR